MRNKKLTKKDYEALADFRRTLRRFLAITEENARKAGLTPQQHQLLLAVKGQRGRTWVSISELAESLQVRHHTAVELVGRCARSGLVRRQRDPQDGRQICVSLEKRGERVLERLSASNRRELRELRHALTLSFLEKSSADGE